MNEQYTSAKLDTAEPLAASATMPNQTPMEVYLSMPGPMRTILRAARSVRVAPRLTTKREILSDKTARRNSGGAFGKCQRR